MSTLGIARSSGLFARVAILTAAALALTFPLMPRLAAQAAQAPPPAAVRAASATTPLPIRRVVLYKSGVGYFEHLGRVRGNQNVTVDFTSGQLDDVLTSLTTLDLDGGRVLGVSYNSEDSLNRRLGALRLPVGEATTRAQFLSALRGARVEVRTGASTVAGRLLSVERTQRATNGAVADVDVVAIVSDAGDIQTVALDPGVSVRVMEADLNQEVGRYLSLVASLRDQDVRRLTISTSGTGDRDLFVSYVSEVPVWKATYRIVLPTVAAPRKPLLQGWAVVDNTVGQDWENVELSLVAGAPQSFIQAISRPYYVQRPVVPLPSTMALAPQTHSSAMATAGAGAIAGTVRDAQGGGVPGVSVRARNVSTGAQSVATTDGTGRFRVGDLPPGSYSVTLSLSSFKTLNYDVVRVSGGMETVLNAVMEVGGVTDVIKVTATTQLVETSAGAPQAGFANGLGRGGAGGLVGGAPASARVDAAQSALQSSATAAPLGDLFEYRLKDPITIRKNQSALVPILSGDIEAEKVSLWSASSPGGRPLRAVWVTNTTGLTLDSGSFSVIEGQAFAGEGLMESFKPEEKRLLSYALDLGVQVDAKGETIPVKSTSVQISRGLLIQHTEERQQQAYAARNEDTEPRVLVVEHPVRVGWTVGGTIKPVETTAAVYRFRITIEPKTTAKFVVEETRTGQTQISISSITDTQIALLVRDSLIPASVEASLRQVIAQKAEIARLSNEMAARQREIDGIGRDQERVRENMRSLKGSSEERQLLQRYVKQLDDQENRLAVLRKETLSLTADRDKAQDALNKFIEAMSPSS
jgi:hypothetical protein